MPAPLTAVVPTFNAQPGRLRRALESLAELPLIGRIAVVDDGSLPPADPPRGVGRVTLIRCANAGPSAARNRGLAALLPLAEEWVVFLDDDDALLPGVGRLIDLMARLGAAAGVGAREVAMPDGSIPLAGVDAAWADRALPYPGAVFTPHRIFGASGSVVHRRVIEAGVRFDEGLRIGEDRDFLRRAAAHGPITVSGAPVLRERTPHEDGRLTSPAHYDRRIRDHLVLVERWCDAPSEPHFREATRWLLNAAAKAGVSEGSWRSLTALSRTRGWGVPMRALWRRRQWRRTGAASFPPSHPLTPSPPHPHPSSPPHALTLSPTPRAGDA